MKVCPKLGFLAPGLTKALGIEMSNKESLFFFVDIVRETVASRKQGLGSIEKFWLGKWLEKWLGFWLEIIFNAIELRPWPTT